MEKIYSKVDPYKVLHIILKNEENFKDERVNIVDSENFIQLSTLCLQKGKTFRPHKHITKQKNDIEIIAQESWIVIKGSVKCILYDIDDSILCERILNKNDVSVTLFGGHNYEILEDDTHVLEYKTGPYFGIEFDKKFI